MESQHVRRKVLRAAVASCCCEHGFVNADNSALETLTEMLQSCECNN